MSDELSNEYLQLVMERTSRHVDKMAEATHNLWNTILTLNGIFLALSSLVCDKWNLSKTELIAFGILTVVPILIILFFNFSERWFNVRIFDGHIVSTKNLLKNLVESDHKDEKDCRTKENRTKQYVFIYSKFVKPLEYAALLSTVIAVGFLFFVMVFHKSSS